MDRHEVYAFESPERCVAMSDNGAKNLSNVKAIIFDYGDVLCLQPTTDDIEGSAQILGISADSFRRTVGTQS